MDLPQGRIFREKGAPLVFGGIIIGKLDDEFLTLLTHDKVKETFNALTKRKTDIYSGEVCIKGGCDGIDHATFLANIDTYAAIICDKGIGGKYCFSPFREVEVPKPPFTDVETAKAAGLKMNPPKTNTRTLSVSTIQDTVFQKLLADVVCDYAENTFARNIDLQSYGYRKGKSSKMAVRCFRHIKMARNSRMPLTKNSRK